MGEGRAFVAGGVQVAVFRLRDGSLHATQAACPHAGGPLADGQTDVDVLVCPLHLYAYRWSDGASTSGAAPDPRLPRARAGRHPPRHRLTLLLRGKQPAFRKSDGGLSVPKVRATPGTFCTESPGDGVTGACGRP